MISKMTTPVLQIQTKLKNQKQLLPFTSNIDLNLLTYLQDQYFEKHETTNIYIYAGPYYLLSINYSLAFNNAM